MKGELLTYPNPKEVGIGPLPMFLSGDINSSNAIVFVAGLTNTLDSVPYVRPLSEALEKEGWCFVQLLTSSSGYGFAHGSLDRDTSEMSSAVSTLRKMGKSKIVIMGHSTGSQDVIHYVNGNYERVDGVIAQAPVSDREAIDDNISKWIPTAIKMIEEGKKDEAMPRESITWFDTPITAYRYWSLFSEGLVFKNNKSILIIYVLMYTEVMMITLRQLFHQMYSKRIIQMLKMFHSH